MSAERDGQRAVAQLQPADRLVLLGGDVRRVVRPAAVRAGPALAVEELLAGAALARDGDRRALGDRARASRSPNAQPRLARRGRRPPPAGGCGRVVPCRDPSPRPRRARRVAGLTGRSTRRARRPMTRGMTSRRARRRSSSRARSCWRSRSSPSRARRCPPARAAAPRPTAPSRIGDEARARRPDLRAGHHARATARGSRRRSPRRGRRPRRSSPRSTASSRSARWPRAAPAARSASRSGGPGGFTVDLDLARSTTTSRMERNAAVVLHELGHVVDFALVDDATAGRSSTRGIPQRRPVRPRRQLRRARRSASPTRSPSGRCAARSRSARATASRCRPRSRAWGEPLGALALYAAEVGLSRRCATRRRSGSCREVWAAFQRDGVPAVLELAWPDARWRPHSAHGRRFESTEEYRAQLERLTDAGERVEAQGSACGRTTTSWSSAGGCGSAGAAACSRTRGCTGCSACATAGSRACRPRPTSPGCCARPATTTRSSPARRSSRSTATRSSPSRRGRRLTAGVAVAGQRRHCFSRRPAAESAISVREPALARLGPSSRPSPSGRPAAVAGRLRVEERGRRRRRRRAPRAARPRARPRRACSKV